MLQRHFGIAPGPPLPYLAGYEIAVSDLGHLARFVAAAGLTARLNADGIAVPLPPAIGSTMIFRSDAG